MEKKQTAVEWFIENDSQLTIDFIQGKITQLEFAAKKAVLKFQALQIEKEQIEDAWLNGMKSEMIAPFGLNRYRPEAEEYYNETYGGNNE
jgi:hypothetical protein